MKKNVRAGMVSAMMTASLFSGVAFSAVVPAVNVSAAAAPVVEYLDRGITAVNTGNGMLVNWRFLASDPDGAVFKLYRDNTLIYTSTEKANGATCFLDQSGNANSNYKVECYNGSQLLSSETCKLKSNNAYFDVKLDRPGSIYTPNDMSVGDVDGDGQYELFVKWDPNNSKDNSQKGKTDKVYIDCYRLDGKKLWRIDLGVNIRAGAHYTQFYVADFDLDGKAEMTCKTADGTIDGTGKVIGDGSKDYRNSSGYVLSGNEYYTLFDGATGKALDTVNYEPARGTVSSWGDKYGNRVDRFWGTTAYLDGIHPCVVTGRGYYTRMTATAYKVENKKLVKLWNFDTGNNSSALGYGDGNHNSMAADVDGDGKQEILTGPTCIDDNGKVKWCINTGHGDALHIGDLDPTNPGLEEWICHEEKVSGYGVTLIDCDTGKTLYHQNGAGDTGRCCADNVWTGNPGAELWGNKLSDNSTPVIDTKGNVLSCNRPAINFLSYWDGDLEREILDGYTDSPATIKKMNDKGKLVQLLSTDGFYTCNTTKGTPCLSADIFGDWREELIVRAASGDAIRIYCTPYDTDYRIQCLMHDPQYRTQVSAQNTAYNQPPHTSFFMGTGYDLPKRPTAVVNGGTPASIGKSGAAIDTNYKYIFRNVNSGLALEVADAKAESAANVQQGTTGANGWTLQDAGDGYYKIYSELGDGKTYLLDLDYGKTENGTNIQIYTDTKADAQLFKFVDMGDGTYQICTKPTTDGSCLGVTAASKDDKANVVEWACNDSNDQKWKLEIKIDPIQGNLVKNLMVKDVSRAKNWKIDTDLQTNDLLFGDREFTYVNLPECLKGSEAIVTSCDSKNVLDGSDLAVFTADKDVTVYIAMDSRQATLPAWLNEYQKLTDTVTSSNDVTFNLYQKSFKAGDTVTLGNNGGNYQVVNYTAMVTPAQTAPVTIKGDVNADGQFDMADVIALQKWLLHDGTKLADWQAGDLSADQKLNIFDLCLMKKALLNSGK